MAISTPSTARSEASIEKPGVAILDEVESNKPNPQDDFEHDEEFTLAEQRKIRHRIDRRLIATAGVMYCISLMDRTNLSAAAIAGMLVDLNLVGFRYSTIALVFFTTYVICQPPATVLCRKIGPRNFLAGICLAWGATMIGFGFPRTWTEMIGLRLILGVLEAGFFPGTVYLISTWYSRYDLQKRYGVFYIIGCCASALGGILAYGIMQMEGLGGGETYLGQHYGPTKENPTAPRGIKSGIAGWRWIFIIEGILTCVIAIGSFFLLVDFPDVCAKKGGGWHFLTEKECNYVIRRINKDRDDAEAQKFNLKLWASSGLDLKVWGFAMIFFCLTTVTYAIAYFLPIILINSMGFSVGASQCLIAPPYAFAGILMFATSWAGDKWRMRGPILIFNAIIALIGLPIMGFAPSSAVRYFGVFLTTAGANANIPAAMAYQANNIRGQWKRAFCSATLVGFGGVGGIAGSLVFRSQDAPSYRPGIYAAIACNCLIIVIVVVQSIYFRACNRKADKGLKIIEGQEGFRYTI